MTMIEHEPEILQPEPEQQQPRTKGDLARLGMDAVDRNRAGMVKVSATAGGLAFASAIEVMDFAKLMAVADAAIPQHLRNNPGMCLAVTFQAVEWRMSPFAVANKSYVVNDRIAYESQLVHAVIEARAPLRERLDCRYEGEGPEQKCTVIGKFRDGTEREYTSPMFKDIKTKNSPLWQSDVQQQLFYFSSRSWARKWCPDVLLGIYTREEMAELPREEESPPANTLVDRLKNGDKTEGHQNGHAGEELNKVAADNMTLKPSGEATKIKPAKNKPPKGGAMEGVETPKGESHTATLEKGKPASKKQASAAADRAQALGDAREREADEKKAAAAKPEQRTDDPPPQVQTKPKNDAEYQVYALDWIERASDPEEALKRWDSERDMRDDIVVRTKTRNMLRAELERKHGV
jgi:hypothetical protein